MSYSSEITNNGGQQANHTGNALERFVEHTLKERGYTEFINHKDQVFAMRNTIGGKQYSKAIKKAAPSSTARMIGQFRVRHPTNSHNRLAPYVPS